MKVNPIDKDKIAENPQSLPYAHTIGSALIKPMDKGRIKGLAISSMYEQTDMQLNQIKEQIELLAKQAKLIKERIEISEKIYQADCGFKPLIGQVYHLYQKKTNQSYVLSMVSPKEWGASCPYEFINTAQLLSDHTWQLIYA